MRFYRNVYAATNALYAKYPGYPPVFCAAMIVTISHFFASLSIFTILRKYDVFYLENYIPNKFFLLLITIIWAFIVYKYYAARSKGIMNEFYSKPLKTRRWLNAVALLAFFGPLFTFIWLMS